MTRWLARLDRRLLPPLAARAVRLAGSRRRWQALVATGLSTVLAVLLTAAWMTGRDGDSRGIAPLVKIGVTPGEPAPAYLARSEAALAELLADDVAGEAYALVTFDDYLPPPLLTPVIGGVATSAVFVIDPDGRAHRVTAHRVPADVSRALVDVLATAGVDASERELRSEAQRCRCVYAAVVRGSPAVLGAIAAKPDVLAVEPAIGLHRLDRARFTPLRPDQEV